LIEFRRRLLLNALKLFDFGVVAGSFAMSVVIAYGHPFSSLAQLLSVRIRLANLILFGITLLAWHVVFVLCGMYGSKRLASRRKAALDALRATTLCAACLGLVTLAFAISLVSARVILLFWILSSASVILGRLVLRSCLSIIRLHGRNLRQMLILGTNARAVAFAQYVETRPELGYRVLGFVDEKWEGISEFQRSGWTLACDFAGLPDFLRYNVIDEVANYLPLRSSYEHASQVAELCTLHGIILRFQSNIFGPGHVRARRREFPDAELTTFYPGVHEGLALIVKRAFDLVGSAALLLLLAPLLLVVAAAIKLTSKGPIFFKQERIGYNKRRFPMYKFRTMVPDAEKQIADLEALNEASGPVFKIKNDPRITPIGKFLRRTSIDELPQLINVLKGDMSLVGPRPLPVRDYQGFSEDWHRRRFAVRPGLTCLWQIKGRSSITFEQWMELDLQYMDEWSLWLDCKILLRTIPAVLKGSGAV
jgi:exopolysaccharide biosynthesis polyprenyl glycosylphosphotransferase